MGSERLTRNLNLTNDFTPVTSEISYTSTYGVIQARTCIGRIIDGSLNDLHICNICEYASQYQSPWQCLISSKVVCVAT